MAIQFDSIQIEIETPSVRVYLVKPGEKTVVTHGFILINSRDPEIINNLIKKWTQEVQELYQSLQQQVGKDYCFFQ